jgi:gamma-glutamyltranspeptidase
MSALGHLVKQLGPKVGLGNAQVVVVRKDGARVAASDPRGSGRPGAYTRWPWTQK